MTSTAAAPTTLLRRLASMLYDALLVFVLCLLATAVYSAIRRELAEPETLSHQLVLAATIYAFFVGFWSWKGRTLGMQSWGLQLEDSEGRVPGIGACTIRFAVAILSWAALGLGFLWQLVDRDSLTWHDRASGTRIRHYPRTKATKQEAAESA